MNTNYMKDVAELLDVELEEKFYIKGVGSPYRFTHDGLYFEDSYGEWQESTYLAYLLTGKMTIVKHILTAEEKDYLSAVVKPFKDEINYIVKINVDGDECICIDFVIDNLFSFPYFEEGTMYRGMEVNKKYTLEELGL